MAWDKFTLAVNDRFRTQWAETDYDGVVPFAEEGKSHGHLDKSDPWISLYTRFSPPSGGSSRITIGPGGLYRTPGQIICDVYVRDGQGTLEATEIAGAISGIWKEAQIVATDGSVIDCKTPYLLKPGTNNGWLIVRVVTHFEYTYED